jgi:hypothetical protein
MKKTSTVFLFVTFLTLILNPLAMSETDNTNDLEIIYSAYIDELISKCNAKFELRNSQLTNVRREAALYCFKAQFFKRYKKELIIDMVSEGIGVKHHKIHYHLNKRFFNIFREAMAAVPHMRLEMGVL